MSDSPDERQTTDQAMQMREDVARDNEPIQIEAARRHYRRVLQFLFAVIGALVLAVLLLWSKV